MCGCVICDAVWRHAALAAVPGIGKLYAQRLEEAGIKTVDDLKSADADVLAAALKSSVQDGSRSPGPKAIAKWVESAKSL